MTVSLSILDERTVHPDLTWVRDAYIAILHREPDANGLRFFIDRLQTGAMSREEVTARLLHSDEARTTTGMGVFTIPHPGQTRYCFDPWLNMVLKADGSVYPCCSHPPVGIVTANHPLEAVLDGPEMRALRQSLLSGRLDPYCARCRNQPNVEAEHFRRDFALKFFLAGKTADAAGYVDLQRHPELLRHIRFTAAQEGCYGLGSRVFLKPTPQHPKPAVTFRDLRCDRRLMLHVRLDLDAPPARPALFRISMAGGQRAAVQTMLTGKQSTSLSIACMANEETFDITYSIRPALPEPDGISAYFSYPFFDGE